MTCINHVKDKKRLKLKLEQYICILLFIFAIVFSELLKKGVVYGFKICVSNIIPTLFPFFILSDLWNTAVNFRKDSLLAKCFVSMFHINSEGLSSFFIGNVCGFPLGVKNATEKYNDGFFDAEELEAITSICNNPSLAFVVSGIGAGLFHSVKIGITLYLSVVISSIIIGLIFRPSKVNYQKQSYKSRQSFNLIKSIRSAVLSSITVSSYVIFFSGIVGIVKSIPVNSVVISVISSFLEIGTACNILSESADSLGVFCLPLISFSLAFSGLSVFMQTFSFLPDGISKTKYLCKKFFQGIISGIFTFLLQS